ncbi:glycoside hydrolase domain-containing protein [Amycolatopsis echigonensis]|uniref:DUF1906 domain-containing protein n=1 Tax=Amycolatopsis echigonensis TaxID=2576905 RepID=A0A8E2B8E3_9PSEU|nr:glycoside hydrolase domain-containing protein [Amycolatopsis echigonensis]MBB2504330.1 DUF1906 domain-containing protein [Amycolatopsis echigonensis]
MARWADYSAGRPAGDALRRAGFSGVIRYIGLGSEGKQLVASEYRDLVATFGAANVLLVAEAGTGDAWGTETDDDYARGVAYGRIALADARAQGVPDWVGLACAADAHAQAFQLDDVVRYASGFRDVVGQSRCGFYGFSETLAAVRRAGIGSWYWRCGSEPTQAEKQWVNFWQRNRDPQRITVAGVPCDINEVYRIPNTSTEEDDMSAEAERQIGEIYRSVSRVYAETGRDWVEALIMILKLLPYPVDTKAILARGGHSAGDLVNADHSTWETLHFTLLPLVQQQKAQLDLMNTAIAAMAANSEITPERMQQMLDEAASKIKITIDVAQATAPPAQNPASSTVQVSGAAQ